MHATETLQTKVIKKEISTIIAPQHAPTEKQRHLLRAIDHTIRRQILELLYQQGRKTVIDVYTKLRLDQPVASLHLHHLANAGFVSVEGDSNSRLYTVNYNKFKEARQFSSLLWQTWQEKS